MGIDSAVSVFEEAAQAQRLRQFENEHFGHLKLMREAGMKIEVSITSDLELQVDGMREQEELPPAPILDGTATARYRCSVTGTPCDLSTPCWERKGFGACSLRVKTAEAAGPVIHDGGALDNEEEDGGAETAEPHGGIDPIRAVFDGGYHLGLDHGEELLAERIKQSLALVMSGVKLILDAHVRR